MGELVKGREGRKENEGGLRKVVPAHRRSRPLSPAHPPPSLALRTQTTQKLERAPCRVDLSRPSVSCGDLVRCWMSLRLLDGLDWTRAPSFGAPRSIVGLTSFPVPSFDITARLRRKTSHHVPAPPPAQHHHNDSTTSDGGTSASSSQAPLPRPPPLRRRTSHPPPTQKSSGSDLSPLPRLDLPSPGASGQFDDLFHRNGGSRPGPHPIASGSNPHLNPHDSGRDSAASGSSASGMSVGISLEESLARNRPPSFGSAGGASRHGERRASRRDDLLLTVGPRVLPRSFFGGDDPNPPPEVSRLKPSGGKNGRGSSSAGSGGEGQETGSSAGSSSQAGSGGSDPSQAARQHHQNHHPHHPERKKHVDLENDRTPIHNLPDLTIDEEPSTNGDGPPKPRRTSFPTRNVQSELDASMRDLVSKDVFAKLLNDPVGRDRFREWLVKSGSSPESLDSLDFYNDSQAYRKFLEEFRHVGLSLQGSSSFFVTFSSILNLTLSSFARHQKRSSRTVLVGR